MLYDSIAVLAPWLAMILWPITVIIGPGTVLFSLLKWREPLSLVRRSHWRFVLAILLGLLQTGAWVAGIGYLILRTGARAG